MATFFNLPYDVKAQIASYLLESDEKGECREKQHIPAVIEMWTVGFTGGTSVLLKGLASPECSRNAAAKNIPKMIEAVARGNLPLMKYLREYVTDITSCEYVFSEYVVMVAVQYGYIPHIEWMLESGCHPLHVYDHALSYEHLDLLNYLQIKYGTCIE